MEAISFINSTTYGTNMSGWNVTEKGPVPGQIMADLEDGLWFGNKRLPPRSDLHATFGAMEYCRWFIGHLLVTVSQLQITLLVLVWRWWLRGVTQSQHW